MSTEPQREPAADDTAGAAGNETSNEGGGPGPTAAGEQLQLEWDVPPATPATTDFVCWLWAAFPQRNGRLNITQIAKALEISRTTLRRWIAKDMPKMRYQQIRRLHQRAILRGHGHYLWPDLDEVTRRRSELVYADAVRNDELITNEPDRVAKTWRENGTLGPHEVQVVYYPKAHVFGVSAANHEKAQAKVYRHGEVIASTTVPNKYAAVALKQEILRRVDEHRCIVPRHMVPSGRTETWREIGGPTGIRPRLEVSVVRFAGLKADHRLAEALQAARPLIRVTEHEATTAAQACAEMTQPADVVILASSGYTEATWGDAKAPWPGGVWYAGGRSSRAAGMSLTELVEGVSELGGITAPTLIVAAGHAEAGRAQLRELGAGTSLLQVGGRRGAREAAELVEILDRLDLKRDDHEHVADGLRRFTRA
ncbi:helix-turn-helix domain-containing protein [Nocardioides sp. NPDC057764]|uniref:helix-turn-helix domain-containing protein n=1 Tax=Nocardioides sp. NPDC057764 TaxID=3346243 RepID=UPI0036717E5B